MERWSGVLRVPLHPNSRTFHRVGASLCLSPETRTLLVPKANAIFFCGDRVEGTGNPVIERLSNLQKLSEIIVSKFGSFTNAWVIEASAFNGPFAVYKDFIPSVNQYGEPSSYHPNGFPASTSTVSLLSNCLEEAKKVILGTQVDTKSGLSPSCSFSRSKTFILGFSKGGAVLNQIVTELGFSDIGSNANSPDVGQLMGRKFAGSEEIYVVPKTKEDLLNSISEIHYVDVGLNSAGAYLTNHDVCEIQEVQPAATSSGSSEKSIKASISMVGPDNTSPKSTSKGKIPLSKAPIPRNNGKPLRKQISGATTGVKTTKNSPMGKSVSRNRAESTAESALEKPERAPVLLKQARDLISSGDNPHKALDLALQAMKLFEKFGNEKPSLELVMCLHVTAAIYCSLGQYGEAIPILERSIEVPVIGESQQHALAKFAGHMQLGDTYAMLGQLENSTMCYTTGLEVQKQILGETDPRVGETCRYVAEANVQALQFDEAERLCQMALDIHIANNSAPSLEEAADRRLMGLICETKGNHETALEHLVLASMAMVSNDQEAEVASVDCSIGDTYLSLSRYDEAVFAYQKALTVFKTSKGENHPAVGLVFVRLADLYNRTGKIRESKSYCESALKIYENPMPGIPPEEIASGLTNISTIYESMNELEHALKLLQKALEIYNDTPGQQSTIAGIEAQMGVMYYMLGNYSKSYNTLKNAISKLRAIGEKKSSFFGIALNQMGLACVQRYALSEATELFEEAKSILEQEYGPYHPETLGVSSNLAATYDAIGRLDDAIQILEYVVNTREEKLGTANPEVDDEKRRLGELLKEAGRVRSRKTRSLENLLDGNAHAANNVVIRA